MSKRTRVSESSLGEIPETQSIVCSQEFLTTTDHIQYVFERMMECIPAASCGNLLASWLLMSDAECFLSVSIYHRIQDELVHPVSMVRTHNTCQSLRIKACDKASIELCEEWNADIGVHQKSVCIEYTVMLDEKIRFVFTYGPTCSVQIDTQYISKDTYTEYEDHIVAIFRQILEIQDPPYLKVHLVKTPLDVRGRIKRDDDLFQLGVVVPGIPGAHKFI